MCFRPPSIPKPKKCENCGAMNAGALRVCRHCGANLPEPEVPEVACPQCGAMNPETAEVCATCGFSSNDSLTIKAPQKPSMPSVPSAVPPAAPVPPHE